MIAAQFETLFETKGSRGQSTVRRSAAEDSVGCARCDRSNLAVPVQEMDSPEGKRTRSQSLNGRPSGLAPWHVGELYRSFGGYLHP